ncbi:hypothetical protein TNIN_45831 [Trichonephila inaurata madagascariensis]|uniref:Uncharacterized protein n=1 Tax=Trichonephila inaurata madagascariensis TaxID=2747483 RepID=A0A8X6JYC9_9ARAC|nr:hypothetical protein TNIN_45831 [Trichonephila inaurata madagascariensis]
MRKRRKRYRFPPLDHPSYNQPRGRNLSQGAISSRHQTPKNESIYLLFSHTLGPRTLVCRGMRDMTTHISNKRSGRIFVCLCGARIFIEVLTLVNRVRRTSPRDRRFMREQ